MESVDVYYFSIKLLLLLLLFRMVRFDAYDYSLSNYFSFIFLHHHCYIYQLYFFLSPLSNFCNTIGTFTIFFFSISSLIFGHRQGINWAAIVALGMPNSQFLSSLLFFFLRNSAILLPNFDSLLTQLINLDQCTYR